MNNYQSLNHTKWDCKFHVVWIPKYRKKTLYGQVRKQLVPIFKELARQKESEIMEGHLVMDHVHMLISVPPKYAIAQIIGFIKGKSAIWISRMCGRQRNFIGQNFWARGYCVSTIGLDENVVREYIKRQEDEDKKLDQLKMFEE
ncbi:MAG: IS200/IS605 family transposase [Syntrophus sp. (in: bacteria)]|nr:IS200/IS605 family transposase [Syntrophus sp. (in: bacteria)]